MDDPIEVRVSTVGRVHPHVECKIIDPQTGAIVPRGTRGELCTRGYVVMLGYWNDAAATARAVDAARWMHTGDLATMNEDGYVSISGPDRRHDHSRRREHLSARDRGVPPHASEDQRRLRHRRARPATTASRCARGSRLRDGEIATADEVREFCQGQIATYKIPRYVRFTTDFPMTVTGKVQKFRMREIFVEELGLSAITGT